MQNRLIPALLHVILVLEGNEKEVEEKTEEKRNKGREDGRWNATFFTFIMIFKFQCNVDSHFHRWRENNEHCYIVL